MLLLPSGKVTVTVLPASAMPLTVRPPSALALTFTLGASGAVVSANSPVADGPVLPAASVALAVTSPVGCPAGEVMLKAPSLPATTEPVVPSGKVTVTVLPASALPVRVTLPSPLVTSGSSSGASGAVPSVYDSTVAAPVLPAASVALALTSPLVCGTWVVTL